MAVVATVWSARWGSAPGFDVFAEADAGGLNGHPSLILAIRANQLKRKRPATPKSDGPPTHWLPGVGEFLPRSSPCGRRLN